MAERRYDQRELAQILRDAGKLQMSGPDGEDGTGLTLAEIQHLAAEVGIDPANIVTAASRLSNSPGSSARGWGAPSQMIAERVFPGELSEAAWEEMVADARSSFGSIGTLSTFGTGREWVSGGDMTTAHLRASFRNGQTHVRLTLRQAGGVAFSWIMAGAIAFVLALPTGIRLHKAGFDGAVAFAFALAAIAMVATACYLFVANWGRNNQRTFDSVVEHIGQIAEGAATTPEPSRLQAQPTESEISTSLPS